ncbi:PREDICTED: low-temperature-induced 65 kDa protein-like [Tarenaya hassleriana]|uniref:low-temperature-induced 65 kDa protein-like n=1 Tax=Tarenaya hassleriana TaxID=28532 RepID=UPI00053C2A00|nr:PREDICTED: low-temperature-induced 65 kDa protein-like [Tarenaya hassleriana]
MESQLTRPSDSDYAETHVKIHHPEEEEHHEKGTAKVLKKVKEKAKKIKNTITKHGHHHEHGHHVPDDHDLDEEDDDDDELVVDPEVHGAPIYESSAVRGGVTGQPESLSHPGKGHIPAPEEMVPPGTKVFPTESYGQIKPVEPVEVSKPAQGFDSSHGLGGTAPHPMRASDPSDPEETAQNTPPSLLSVTEDTTRMFVSAGEDPHGQRKVNLERPKGLEEDRAAPGGGLDSSGVVSNYQSKVTDPTGKSGEEVGVTPIIESLGKMKMTDVPHELSERGLERESLTRRDELDVKSGHEPGKDFPTPEMSPPENPKTETGASKPQAMADDADMPKQSSYTEKIVSATSALADRAAAAKTSVASKLGYSGGEGSEEETPRSAMEYGKKMAEKLTPVYEKVKETGTSVMSKMPLSGSGETGQRQDKGVSARDYIVEKLKPGEEDKALSEVITEKLHLGGEKKKKRGTVMESEEVKKRLGGFSDERSEKEMEHGESFVEDGNGGGGMVEKLKLAVTSWLGGKTEEVKNKSAESVQESSQSLGSTIGTELGLAGTNGGDVGGNGGGGRKLQESGN